MDRTIDISLPPLPMVICAVCRTWREIALSSPELWSTVYVPLIVTETQPRRLLCDAVKFTNTWLARSKEASLDIFLRIPNVRLAFDLSVNAILPKILHHGHRLRRLLVLGDVSGLAVNDVKGILTLISNHMADGGSPQLHTLALKFASRGPVRLTSDQVNLDRDWDFIPDSPPTFPASHLSIQGIRLSPSFFPHLVSLQAAHLEATYLEFESLFSSLPSLSSLSLPHLRVLTHLPPSPGPIVVPTLCHLALSFHRRPFNSTLPYPVAYLRLQNLKNLSLDGDGNVPICSCFDVSFVSSLSSLDCLSLRNFVRFSLDPASETTWNDVQLLHSLSTIKHLQLIHSPVGNVLLQPQLTSRPRKRSLGSRPAVSPHLTETHRTLEGLFQVMRINASRPPAALDRTVPIASFPSSPPGFNWPILETISMDTIVADDIVKLCQYVSGKPILKTVHLSASAFRHLAESVKKRRSDGAFFSTNFFTKRDEWGALQEQETGNPNTDVESAHQWLTGRVQVLPFDGVNCLHDEY